MKESQRTSLILKAIYQKKPNWYLIKQVQSGMSTIGVPDILGSINGHFVGIEVKRFGNEVTDPQIRQLRKIQQTGALAGVFVINDKVKPITYCLAVFGPRATDIEIRSAAKDRGLPWAALPETLDKIEETLRKTQFFRSS